MCRQSCEGCPLYHESLAGMIESRPDDIIELSVVGTLGDELGLPRVAKATIYSSGSRCGTAEGVTLIDAFAGAIQMVGRSSSAGP